MDAGARERLRAWCARPARGRARRPPRARPGPPPPPPWRARRARSGASTVDRSSAAARAVPENPGESSSPTWPASTVSAAASSITASARIRACRSPARRRAPRKVVRALALLLDRHHDPVARLLAQRPVLADPGELALVVGNTRPGGRPRRRAAGPEPDDHAVLLVARAVDDADVATSGPSSTSTGLRQPFRRKSASGPPTRPSARARPCAAGGRRRLAPGALDVHEQRGRAVPRTSSASKSGSSSAASAAARRTATSVGPCARPAPEPGAQAHVRSAGGAGARARRQDQEDQEQQGSRHPRRRRRRSAPRRGRPCAAAARAPPKERRATAGPRQRVDGKQQEQGDCGRGRAGSHQRPGPTRRGRATG